MLDRLEAEINALRTRAMPVGGDPGTDKQRSNGAQRAKSNGQKRRTSKAGGKAGRGKVPPVTQVPAQITLAEAESPQGNPGEQSTPQPRSAGKRQALGRSLLQLRKGHGTPGPH
jgi:hypothetical protein